MTFAGLAYNKSKVTGADIPKTYQDINNPRFRNKISCKISSSGIQYVQWYLLRQIHGNDFWKEFAKQRPRAFDSRVQLFDRLAKGDDDMTALAEYSAYILYKIRGADVEFIAPPEGLVATPLILGAVNKAPHPEAAKLFIDWAMSPRGQKYYQDHPNLYYGSLTNDPPADADGPEALRLQADLSEGLGRLRQDARRVQQGMERDAGAVMPPAVIPAERTREPGSIKQHPRVVRNGSRIAASRLAGMTAERGCVCRDFSFSAPGIAGVFVAVVAGLLVLYPVAYLLQAALNVGDPGRAAADRVRPR